MWTVGTKLHSAACFCWTLAVLLHASGTLTCNTSEQVPNGSIEKSLDELDWDSPFLQLRASLPSHSRMVRPYSLVTNTEDYNRSPKPRHQRRSRLFHLLGSNFDPFWMSVDQPSEAASGRKPLSDSQLAAKKFNLGSPVLREAEAISLQKLEKEAADLNLRPFPSDVAEAFRGWLVKSARCELHHQWVDLGPAFWPRWLRQTDCEGPEKETSCSFPKGMRCVRAQTEQVKILAWNCLAIRDNSKNPKGEKSKRTQTETRQAVRRCSWRPVPYPVVTSCTCSCK